jgi:hypothetical protein
MKWSIKNVEFDDLIVYRQQLSRGPFVMPSTNILRRERERERERERGVFIGSRWSNMLFMERNAGGQDKIKCNREYRYDE